MGQLALVRLSAPTKPMPPAGAPAATSAEVATFGAWVDAGMPLGSCGSIDPTGGQPTCATNSYWTQGNRESSDMNPGLACLACHASSGERDKSYVFSGTVFPAFHEKDQCSARPPSGVRVEIYDKNGALVLAMTPQPFSGNFHSSTSVSVALPYTAKVVANGRISEMTTPQTNGDCNGCHTVQGTNGAYGRIVWP